jgi:hypothetical protein
MDSELILQRDDFKWLGITFTGHRVVKSALIIIYTHVEVFSTKYEYMMFDWEAGIVYFSNDKSIITEEFPAIHEWCNASDWYTVHNLIADDFRCIP